MNELEALHYDLDQGAVRPCAWTNDIDIFCDECSRGASNMFPIYEHEMEEGMCCAICSHEFIF